MLGLRLDLLARSYALKSGSLLSARNVPSPSVITVRQSWRISLLACFVTRNSHALVMSAYKLQNNWMKFPSNENENGTLLGHTTVVWKHTFLCVCFIRSFLLWNGTGLVTDVVIHSTSIVWKASNVRFLSRSFSRFAVWFPRELRGTEIVVNVRSHRAEMFLTCFPSFCCATNIWRVFLGFTSQKRTRLDTHCVWMPSEQSVCKHLQQGLSPTLTLMSFMIYERRAERKW